MVVVGSAAACSSPSGPEARTVTLDIHGILTIEPDSQRLGGVEVFAERARYGALTNDIVASDITDAQGRFDLVTGPIETGLIGPRILARLPDSLVTGNGSGPGYYEFWKQGYIVDGMYTPVNQARYTSERQEFWLHFAYCPEGYWTRGCD